ncbi:hypothetical protein ARMGADRAFT_817182 [Armillaria gallica]|uniref:Uncharacterized protein n=1 Tax=Armillaria gallica TaxID=47427 RepID=A0A2H3CNZ8_ARMGA|nr:hypothetical protein ARMGADRAFT_817182 [Armillaria gallica]
MGRDQRWHKQRGPLPILASVSIFTWLSWIQNPNVLDGYHGPTGGTVGATIQPRRLASSSFPHTTRQPCLPSILYQTETTKTSKDYPMTLKVTQGRRMILQAISSLRLSSRRGQLMTLKATQGRRRILRTIPSLWT